ncbi:thioesterase II family protein [Streptomyces sp. NPDC056161]|uniref:thioesterase II family protein n=1 Tax=Streptomyces sp. NPDC056161 TaxID=3345732 RepID=UPI0035E20CC6
MTALGRRRAAAPCLTSVPRTDGGPRLFCFHHAGGAASAFTSLRRDLDGVAEVVAVQLPGREGRLRDRLPTTMAEVVAELDEQLDPHVRPDDVFYGHSMGALVAHDVLARRHARGGAGPARLIVGACRAPRHPVALGHRARDSDGDLTALMLQIGGLSPEMARYPEWVRAAVDRIRGDLVLCASREPADSEPLPCPIDVLHGADDPLVDVGQATDWTGHTRAGCRTHRLAGGHFFFLDSGRDAFVRLLGGLVRGTAAVRA